MSTIRLRFPSQRASIIAQKQNKKVIKIDAQKKKHLGTISPHLFLPLSPGSKCSDEFLAITTSIKGC